MSDDRLERMARDLANATEPRITVEQAAEKIRQGFVMTWPIDTTVTPRYIHERKPKLRWWRRMLGRWGW